MSRSLACLVVVALAALTAAVPEGFTIYFNVPTCPAGFREVPESKGRVIVSVEDPSIAGLTVGEPLKNGEDRKHSHPSVGTTNLDSLHIAADSCCNKQGALHGSYRATGSALDSTSGLPYTQLILCAAINETAFKVPFGTVSYFAPDTSACPTNWTGYGPAIGRTLVPGYDQSGPVPSPARALANSEDRVHNHSIYASFQTSSVSYVGVDGCCNNDPAPANTYHIVGDAAPVSSGVPYVQLLTCLSKDESFDLVLPPGALLFSPLLGCPDGWEVASTLSGRFLVALPFGGSAGLSYGGESIPADATPPQHGHSVNGTIDIPASDIGLASGCCAGGYAGAGTFTFEGTSSANSVDFPYLMIPLCQRAEGKSKQ